MIAYELTELRAAGMNPTPGDIRCIAFGHITRMAIWGLRAEWDVTQPTPVKLEAIRVQMNALATMDEVRAALDREKAITAMGLNVQNKENSEQAYAVAF